MPRRLRIESATGVHHVMNRGVDHQQVFFGDCDRLQFESLLTMVREEFAISTLAYCLMGNHFHLLVDVPHEPGLLSEAMHRVFTIYVRRTNNRIGRDGPMFRSRFHSIPVETDRYLIAAARYIHRNPTDLGVVDVSGYRWSSYGAYMGFRACPEFLALEQLLDMFDGDRREFASFTEDRPSRLLAMPITSGDIGMLVKGSIAVHAGRGLIDDLGIRAMSRNVLALLLEQPISAEASVAVQAALGPMSDDALRAMRRRARQRLQDSVVRSVLDQVLQYIPLVELAA